MNKVTVVIPNYNGIKYMKTCLDSLLNQKYKDFQVIVVDNGSTDGSREFVQTQYPQIQLITFAENEGFCCAVNAGIRASKTPYVILLNNDTESSPEFIQELVKMIEGSQKIFSCASKMLDFYHRDIIDDAGNYYNALGWAYARGKGKYKDKCNEEKTIFAACAGAAIYRRELFEQVGMFDEAHFAYLEDVDVGYRARIQGYRNVYAPKAIVYHVGSATTGSRYNEIKIRYAARNSVYLVYKNMPLAQLVLNVPFLFIGYTIKFIFFSLRGMGREYLEGIKSGFAMSKQGGKVRFCWKNLPNYVKIQIELWLNIGRRFY